MDISSFRPRHRLKAGRRKRLAAFLSGEGKLIPWPLSEPRKGVDPAETNVQIAIQDKSYAEALRALLEEDKKHRVYVVDCPNATIDGVVVVDASSLAQVGVLEEDDALRYIALRKDSADPDMLWQSGVRCVVPAEYPPSLVRTVILGTELRLSIEKSARK